MMSINSQQQLWLRRTGFVTANLLILLVAYLIFVEPVQSSRGGAHGRSDLAADDFGAL